MYYVLKKQHSAPMHHFIGFVIKKYRATKANDTVIFEFVKNAKTERKWVKKDEIILLTQDKEYFLEMLNQLKETESIQQELVNLAKEQLEESIETFDAVMVEKIENLKKIKKSGEIDCMLNDF